jgi:hypothetical protein
MKFYLRYIQNVIVLCVYTMYSLTVIGGSYFKLPYTFNSKENEIEKKIRL